MTTFRDSHRDLLDASIAALATVGADRLPQQTAVWFRHEDGELELALNDGGADLSVHDGPGEQRPVIAIEPANVDAVDMRVGQM